MSTQFLINDFQHPYWLLALPIPIILLVVQIIRERRKQPSVIYSDLSIAKNLPGTWKTALLKVFPWTRTLALILGIIALARPQYGTLELRTSAEIVDISLVIDVSGSMQEQDFHPNRLEAAKKAAIQFVEKRKSDRVSVVLFGLNAAILCPPTLDMVSVQSFISRIHNQIINNNKTAVGDGLALAVKQITESKEEDVKVASRVVVLLTDGESNSGSIQPLQAAEIAESLGVRVYTIGMGGGSLNRPGFMSLPRARKSFDEESLIEIARITGGKYFHADSDEKLDVIYDEIDQMERTEVKAEESVDYDERFMIFWFPGLLLLGLEFFLRAFLLRRLP